jgi:hypothetical protein
MYQTCELYSFRIVLTCGGTGKEASNGWGPKCGRYLSQNVLSKVLLADKVLISSQQPTEVIRGIVKPSCNARKDAGTCEAMSAAC